MSAGSFSFRRADGASEALLGPDVVIAYDRRLQRAFVPRTRLARVFAGEAEPAAAQAEGVFLDVSLSHDRKLTAVVGGPNVRLDRASAPALPPHGGAAPEQLAALQPPERAVLSGVHVFADVLFLEGVFSAADIGDALLVGRSESYAPFVERNRRLRALVNALGAADVWGAGGVLSRDMELLPPVLELGDEALFLEQATRPRRSASRALFPADGTESPGGGEAADGAGALRLPAAHAMPRSASMPGGVADLGWRSPFKQLSRRSTPIASPLSSPRAAAAAAAAASGGVRAGAFPPDKAT